MGLPAHEKIDVKKSLCLAAFLGLFSQINHASEFWENWDVSMSAGYGERSNPLLNADDIKTYINIDIAWYGDRFFFDNGDIGYNAYYGDNLSLNFIGQLNNERVFFGKTNTRFVSIGDIAGPSGLGADAPGDDIDGNPLPAPDPVEYEVADRNHAYEAGVEAIIDGDWGQVQISLLQDISNQHKGQRADIVFSQTRIWKRWLVQPSFGLAWKSNSLADYYFGVEADESNDIVSEYEVSATTNQFARVLFNYALKSDLFWGLALEYEKLGDQIVDSPIVAEDDVFTAYTGIKYRF